jgi:hypothetical protein
LELLLDFLGQSGRVGFRGFEEDIAAGEDGFDVLESEGFKSAFQIRHADEGIAADVDAAEERDVR